MQLRFKNGTKDKLKEVNATSLMLDNLTHKRNKEIELQRMILLGTIVWLLILAVGSFSGIAIIRKFDFKLREDIINVFKVLACCLALGSICSLISSIKTIICSKRVKKVEFKDAKVFKEIEAIRVEMDGNKIIINCEKPKDKRQTCSDIKILVIDGKNEYIYEQEFNEWRRVFGTNPYREGD